MGSSGADMEPARGAGPPSMGRQSLPLEIRTSGSRDCWDAPMRCFRPTPWKARSFVKCMGGAAAGREGSLVPPHCGFD